MNRSRRQRLAVLLLAALLAGCSIFDEVNPTEKKKSGGGGGEAPPPVPTTPVPTRLTAPRLARRLALDLGLKLPAEADIDLLNADAKNYPQLVDSYLAQAGVGRALAGLHPRMWHLDSRSLPDLDGFVAGGDTALATSLTREARLAIVDEPSLYVRWAIDKQRPFPELFTATFGLAPASLLPFWNIGDDGEVFTGEPYRFTTYPDSRPAAGLLADDAFAAAFSSHGEPLQRARTSRMLGELLCLQVEAPAAHLFTELTSDELQTDLATLAMTRPACAGCHMHFETSGAALSGLGSGADFASWLAYTAPDPVSGNYAGQSFSDLGDLAALIGNDPRTHRCELQKLLQAVYQRPFFTSDGTTLDLAINEFYDNGLRLDRAARRIFLSDDYAFGVLGPNVKGTALRQSSGVRILGRAQWQGILAELAPGATGVELTDDLDPGHDETLTSDYGVPSGGYWHRVDRVARQVAAAVVAAELADNASATARRLLTDLPDGAGDTADQATINLQIKHIWKKLTTEDLADSNQTYLDFQALWTAAHPGAGDDFRRAWRTMLVAMLTHPAFLSY